MHNLQILPSIVILLSVSVFVVILFKKLKLSPVLGYFVAGAIIGEHGLEIVRHEQISTIGEYGVVFLLYAIGLELSLTRLRAMRQYVFGLGGMQVVLTSVILAGIISLIDDNGSRTAVLVGGGLALSSTAVVLQILDDSKSSSTQVGRISFAILLLQDFAVVPLLVVTPKLAGSNLSSIPYAIALSIGKAAIALIVIFIVGRMFFRPIFRLISSDSESSNNELFIAMTLLIALASAFGTDFAGLSLELGAFTAGVLVAETEYQRKAEESIYPFKGLLLGLFFMSVGMTIDIKEIYANINSILIFTFGLVSIKALIVTALCTLFRFNTGVSIHSGLMLAQGGEFAFILFKLGMREGIIPDDLGNLLLLVVTCSMALTPLLALLGSKLELMLSYDKESSPQDILEKGTRDMNNHVIIAGFGRVGKMVARILDAENINYIIIDINSDNVKEEEVNGFPIFKGDISNYSTLLAAGADRALGVILAISNKVTQKKALKNISKNFPQLCSIVRSPDLRDANELYELGATIIVPEDYETGLQLGGAILKAIGVNEHEITRTKEQFRAGNYILAKQYEDVVD